MAHRVYAARLEDLREAEGIRVTVGETTVAVFRRGDRVHALGDSCPHMGASLSEGFLDATSVVCPWHGWAFDLRDGSSPFDPEARVPVYGVVVEDGAVYVVVDEEAASRVGPCDAEGGCGHR